MSASVSLSGLPYTVYQGERAGYSAVFSFAVNNPTDQLIYAEVSLWLGDTAGHSSSDQLSIPVAAGDSVSENVTLTASGRYDDLGSVSVEAKVDLSSPVGTSFRADYGSFDVVESIG